MLIVFRLALIVLATLLISPTHSLAETTTATQTISESKRGSPAEIEVFVRTGCPHCAEAERFLADLQRENPSLRIVIRDVLSDGEALTRLKVLAEQQAANNIRVPAFYIGQELLFGFSAEASSGKLIREMLAKAQIPPSANRSDVDSCAVEESRSCNVPDDGNPNPADIEAFQITLLGYDIRLQQTGLPLFTLAMGLLDGFNPCSLWVLILMISMLAPMGNRLRMLAIAGTFVAVEGIAYFLFMAAWLNLFLLVGLSRLSEQILAGLAILAGAINLKDFWAFGKGISLSIPASAKPGIYTRMRAILQAQNLTGAILATVILAVLVQIVELMCTSGFPALYTRILTLQQFSKPTYYAYLLLYNFAYMLDDVLILLIGVITLSERRLQEKEGRVLKLLSGLVMIGLGVYLAWGA